jgi:hypothetical protein
MANPAVMCRDMEKDETVLINLDTGVSLALNHTGMLIWQFSNGRRTVEQLVNSVRNCFQEAPLNIADDVNELLAILEEDGFIGFEWTGSNKN